MKNCITAFLFLLVAGNAYNQQRYQPAPENLENRSAFQDDKFGIFIHWGIYSMLADGEWVQNNKNINHNEYQKLASGFYPSKFDAAKWVAQIKVSGARYICITARHHDGFSMFDTKASDYNIVKATPFKRDVLKELAGECRKQGIQLHFYYSHLDWDREDYPRGRTGLGNGRTGMQQNWDSYFKFMNDQLKELLTNYGDVRAIWFDGKWDQDIHPEFDWRLPEQYGLIHSLKPAVLIGNNHHESPITGEDFQMFERDLPGQNHSGLSGQEIGELPLETCETMNKSWGYTITDTSYKTVKELIHLLVRAAGNNANLLLNVGPQPNGEIPAQSVERLKAMGDWLQLNGESIYGTRGGMISPRDWGVTTQKGNRLFVHILNLKDNVLFLPVKDKPVKSVMAFNSKKRLKFTQDKNGMVITLDKVPDEMDYILELDF